MHYLCRDRVPSCRGWAAAGECRVNPNFMLKECEASCGQCPMGTRDDARSSGAAPLVNTPLRAAQLRGRAWWGYTSVATGSTPTPNLTPNPNPKPTPTPNPNPNPNQVYPLTTSSLRGRWRPHSV